MEHKIQHADPIECPNPKCRHYTFRVRGVEDVWVCLYCNWVFGKDVNVEKYLEEL